MSISEDIKHKQLLSSNDKINKSLDNITSSVNKINKSLDNIDNTIKRLITILERMSSANKAIDYLYNLGCTTNELLAVGVLTEDDMVDESEED